MRKITLCKKVVHDAFEKDMWKNLFDWIIWFSLRRLKKQYKDSEYENLEDLFHDEYFQLHFDDRDLIKFLWRALKELLNTYRTLFILDEVNEMSQKLNDETHMSELLKYLLSRSQIIVTSQLLDMSRSENLNLKLKMIEFRSKQVNEYFMKVTAVDAVYEAQVQIINEI